MPFLWLFILLALFAEILGTIGGFGSSVFFVPVANFFLDFQSVLGLTALFHLSSNITKISMFRKGVDWKLVLLIGIPAISFVILGAYLANTFESKPLQIAMGFFLIILSLVFLIFKSIKLKSNAATSISGGVVSGFLAGLLGSGGPIRGLTLAAYDLRKEVFIATSAFIDLGIDLSRATVYISNGFVHKDQLYLVAILVAVGIVGTWLGKKVLDQISQERFRQIVLILILIIGIVSLFNPQFRG